MHKVNRKVTLRHWIWTIKIDWWQSVHIALCRQAYKIHESIWIKGYKNLSIMLSTNSWQTSKDKLTKYAQTLMTKSLAAKLKRCYHSTKSKFCCATSPPRPKWTRLVPLANNRLHDLKLAQIFTSSFRILVVWHQTSGRS